MTLANHLHDQLGLDVTIVTLDGGVSSYPVSPGVTVRTLWTHHLSLGVLKVVTLPIAALAFAATVRSVRADAAISFLVRANLVMVLSRWLGNPLPARISERIVSVIYSGWSPTAPAMRTLVRALYPHAASVVAISEGVKRSVVGLGVPAERVRVIYNPQNIAEIAAEARMPEVRTDDSFRLVMVGRLTAQKDVPTALRALAKVRLAGERVTLVVLGEGPDKARLKELAVSLGVADAVEWRGWSRPYRALAAGDVFVLSSRYEGFANVIVEAMACGSPVVSTDCDSGPREILADGMYGILVPVGDSDALAAAIVGLAWDPDRREELRRRGRERARDFDVSVIAPAYLEGLSVSAGTGATADGGRASSPRP